ncbi:hypothetical protein BGZ65_012222 [Modicella reniformis]|uniref:Uncharacterized protein n=1 Tax=Modicella reniformis TaxID=1440133 RepID=A0A9P6LTP6_9FUNG|nr:hypothetical protein BGZ65_012222 [Modicella reniformis]
MLGTHGNTNETLYGTCLIKPNELTDVENMTVEFVNAVLFPPSSLTQNARPGPVIHLSPHHQHNALAALPQQSGILNTNTHTQQEHSSQSSALTGDNHHLRQPLKTARPTGSPVPVTAALLHSGENPLTTMTPTSISASVTSTLQPEPFKKRIAHLLTDERRFHAPLAVLDRVHQFFKGPPQLDPAAFKGSTISALISVPFPDIMDTDGWLVPVGFNSSDPAMETSEFGPVQTCFLHVPILPSKRLYETETEVVLLDDVRLVAQLNAKLWEEFSSGNVAEAISLVPTSATWFGKTELADWPCVIMSGLKFEQANNSDPSRKKCSEIHSYIVVYLGRDPLRQAQFVQTFQDLGISPPQHPEGASMATLTTPPDSRQLNGHHHRWIAGFRRLFRAQGLATSGSGSGESWHVSQDDDKHSIDPQFDDIYSILPPFKKQRLERVGRPSDAQADWHHSKRRKRDGSAFSKLKDHNQDNRRLESDDEMSE